MPQTTNLHRESKKKFLKKSQNKVKKSLLRALYIYNNCHCKVLRYFAHRIFCIKDTNFKFCSYDVTKCWLSSIKKMKAIGLLVLKFLCVCRHIDIRVLASTRLAKLKKKEKKKFSERLPSTIYNMFCAKKITVFQFRVMSFLEQLS